MTIQRPIVLMKNSVALGLFGFVLLLSIFLSVFLSGCGPQIADNANGGNKSSDNSSIVDDNNDIESVEKGNTPDWLKPQTESDLVAPVKACLLYTSPSPRDATLSRMPSSA